MNKLIALLAAIVFGFGLGVSGMTNPAKVLAFLDFFGHWDPTLAFVMGGAVLVAFPAFQLARRSERPLLASKFQLPTATAIDCPLVTGAALFGIGWGIAGFCPGPAIAALGSLQWPIFAFLAAMITGQWLADQVGRRSELTPPAGHQDTGNRAGGNDRS